jgi:radical SAM superfamily enzyme YgiQ (UPF0313 family)
MKIIKKLKIRTMGLFILGLPGENYASALKTIRFAKKLGCDTARFNLAIPYPGSPFFQDYFNHNQDCLENPQRFTTWNHWSSDQEKLLYVPEGMKEAQLLFLQKRAMLEFYLRPSIIFQLIFKYKLLKILLMSGYIV